MMYWQLKKRIGMERIMEGMTPRLKITILHLHYLQGMQSVFLLSIV